MPKSDQTAHVDGPPLDTTQMRWPADYPTLGSPGKPAVIFKDQITTYGQLDRGSSAFVTLMRGRGISPGERIAYLGRNSDIYLPVVFGNLRAGTVLVPLNWRYAAPEIAFILEDAQPKLVICDVEFSEVVRAAAPNMSVLITEGDEGLRQLIGNTKPAAREAHDPDVPAMLMYTSGTTGKPKGVCVSHRMYALARHAEIVSPYYAAWEADDVLLSPMPNFHMGALSWLLGGFCRGLTCVVTADTTPKGLLALCQAHDVARTFIVPTVVRGMLEEMRAQDISLPKLKEIHYGAAPMDVALLQASIERIGCQFLHHYGMTENAGTATRLGPGDHDIARPHLLRSVGKPQAGLSLEIRGADGHVARRGEPGEIWIRSPTVMPGYWLREEASREVVASGWYRTGDGGYLDDQGFLFLTDRIKDMIVSGGENIYPVEVEEALRSHPAILDVAVFGMPDPYWGEAVVAAVEFRPGQRAEESELAAHIRARIAAYKAPKRYLLDIFLPRTATGKVQRGEMRKRFRSR